MLHDTPKITGTQAPMRRVGLTIDKEQLVRLLGMHWIQRRHGDAFAYSMGDLYSVIEDVHPGLYVRTLNNLTALAKNNEGLFKSLREINNDPLIQNKNYGYINPDTRQRVNGMKNGRDLG